MHSMYSHTEEYFSKFTLYSFIKSNYIFVLQRRKHNEVSTGNRVSRIQAGALALCCNAQLFPLNVRTGQSFVTKCCFHRSFARYFYEAQGRFEGIR